MEAGHMPSDALDRRLAPLLLMGHGDDNGISAHSLPRGEKPHLPGSVRVLMRDHRIWATPQGWLLMARRGSPETFLWDPFTGTRIGLSPDHDGTILAVDDHRRRRLCLLSRRRPTDPGCLVLVVDLQDTVLWYCRPCRPGRGNDDDEPPAEAQDQQQQWAKHEYLQPGRPHHEHRSAVLRAIRWLTAVDGKFLTALFGYRLVVLEFSPEPVLTVVAAGDISLANTCNSSSLVESDGELYYVWFSYPIECYRIVARVSVYKLDYMAAKGGSAKWVKVNSLGGTRSVFIGQDGFRASFDAQEAGLKANCIYYWLPKNRAALYVHDMERGTTAVDNPYPNHLSPAIVIMPTTQ